MPEPEKLAMMTRTLYDCEIEAETKWPPFCRRHFQIHFLLWKLLHFDSNFTNGPIKNHPALVLVTVWQWATTKPLSEPLTIWYADELPQWYMNKMVIDILKRIFFSKIFLFFYPNFTVHFWGYNWQQVSISSGNGLAPNKRQVTTQSIVDPDLWRDIIMASLSHNELKQNWQQWLIILKLCNRY